MIANLRGGDDLKSLIKVNDWNQLHIIARGNALTRVLNGHLTAVKIADDATNRAMGGLIGFQTHVGPPMKSEQHSLHEAPSIHRPNPTICRAQSPVHFISVAGAPIFCLTSLVSKSTKQHLPR